MDLCRAKNLPLLLNQTDRVLLFSCYPPPMDSKSDDKDFSPADARKRFEAALKGARIAGPQHKEV